jgi:hypothetical protein
MQSNEHGEQCKESVLKCIKWQIMGLIAKSNRAENTCHRNTFSLLCPERLKQEKKYLEIVKNCRV